MIVKIPAKILFVDDQPDLEILIRQKFKQKIHAQEYEFIFARTGVEALEKLAEYPDIDMVVSDINMPEMDGLILIKKLNHINPTIKTVIISAYNDMKNVRQAMNNGAFDFLTKPIDLKELEITIEKTLCHVQEIKENLRSRQEQEKMLRHQALVFENIYDGVVIIDLQGEIIDWNPSIGRMFGYSKEEVLAKTPEFLHAPMESANLLPKILKCISSDRRWIGEISFICKNGTKGVSETAFVPLYSDDGERIGAIGVYHDISDRKQKELEIEQALEREKKLIQLKSRFLSIASHELRAPLTTIFTASDLLKRFPHKFTEDKKQERLNKIQAEVKNMTQLLDDILTIGKAEAGKIEFQPFRVNLQEVCQSIVDELKLTNGQTHTFVFSFEGDCNQVIIDQKLLASILNNLLSNAIKYSPTGSTVYFNLSCKNKQAIFTIKDEGIGIPIPEQERLFEVFHRASNVGNIYGTGLGMAIVKQAVELHGGSINFESQVGLGTTFIVCLPISQTEKRMDEQIILSEDILSRNLA